MSSRRVYVCERCHDSGFVYPDSAYGTRDDDMPCPDCTRRWGPPPSPQPQSDERTHP